MQLPSFPVDETTLDLLWSAMFPKLDEHSEVSSVFDVLHMYSQLGGADTEAVDEDDDANGYDIVVLRDPQYHIDDVVAALIMEVRRLREEMQ